MPRCPHGPCPPPRLQKYEGPTGELRPRRADRLASRTEVGDGERYPRPSNARSRSAAIAESAIRAVPGPNHRSDGERPLRGQPSIAPIQLNRLNAKQAPRHDGHAYSEKIAGMFQGSLEAREIRSTGNVLLSRAIGVRGKFDGSVTVSRDRTQPNDRGECLLPPELSGSSFARFGE